ncbi:MAG: NAD(P)H-dependent oxidoreductase [Pseudomonadota bacterium]
MKILAFGASNSTRSINHLLATYAASLIDDADVTSLDLNEFEMPIFSVEREAELGHQELAKQFLQNIADADGLIISLAEHNGSYSVAFKNVFDWASRIDSKVYQNKPVLFLSTSPGSRGGANVMSTVLSTASHFGAEIVASLSVPSFYENFDVDNMRAASEEIRVAIDSAAQQLAERLKE